MNKRWFPFIALFFWVGFLVPSHAETAAQIISEARVYLKDQSQINNRQQFSDETLLQFMTDGQREANSICWLLQSTYTIQLTANTTYYSLPSDFMATQFVTYLNVAGTTTNLLPQTSLNQLNADSQGWQSAQAGTPQAYWIYNANPSQIWFYPAPSASSTGTITVYYVQQPVELTSTTQTPFNSWPILTPYQSGLVYYVVYRAYLTLEEPASAQPFQQDWLQFLNTIHSGINKMPDFNPGLAGSSQINQNQNTR